MYKIMYNNSKAECVVGLLTPGCAPRLSVYLRDGNVSRQVHATHVGPLGMRLSGFKITHLLQTTGEIRDESDSGGQPFG